MKSNAKTIQYDAQIAQLFDGFAESLPQQTHLSQAAMLQAEVTRVKRTRRSKHFGFGRIFAVAVLCVAVFVAMFSLPGLIAKNNQNSDSQNPASAPTIYSATEVSGKALASANALQPSISAVARQYTVTYERYCAYYFKTDGKLAYIHALLGVETDSGIVEVDLIAETAEYVLQSRAKIYNNIIKDSDRVALYGSDKLNGEFVTQAYFAANSFNFYIVAQSNPQNNADVQKIIDAFYQTWDKTA